MTRTLNVIAFIVFASALFIRSTDPVIPLIADGLHVEPATAALLSTAFTLPYALVQPLLGALADMMSKVRLMLLCMILVTAATLACAFAPSFEFLLIGRIIAGLAAGGVVPISFALVGDMIPIARAPGGDGPRAVRHHDRQPAGRGLRRRGRRSDRLARRVPRHRRARRGRRR